MLVRFSRDGGATEVGRYENAPIYLHHSFLITAAILAWPFWSMMSLRGLALAVLFMAVIFASILQHEIAHAVVARRYGLPVLRIDIHMLGGLVQFRYLPLKRWQDFAITLAGPMCNLAIGLVALALLGILPETKGLMSEIPTQQRLLEPLLRAGAYLNLGLCAVNLIPAFPLDGGKLVYLVIDKRWDARLATLVVSALGLVFAGVSTLVLIGTALSGFPIWAPPSFAINWRAFQGARRGRGGWNRHASGV